MQYFVRIFSSQWSRAKFEAQHKKEKGFCLLFNFVLLFPSPLLDLEKGNRTRIKKRNNRWMDKEVVVYISSVQFSHPVVSDSLRPHELHRSPWPSPTSGVYPNPYPLSQWCHPSISSSVVHFPSTLNLSQHQGLFKRVSSSHQVAKYWRFSFNISLSNEHPGLISFRMVWLDLLAVQGTCKSLFQYHSSKASVLLCSAFFIVQLSHLYMKTGKTIALTRRTFFDKVMSLL